MTDIERRGSSQVIHATATEVPAKPEPAPEPWLLRTFATASTYWAVGFVGFVIGILQGTDLMAGGLHNGTDYSATIQRTMNHFFWWEAFRGCLLWIGLSVLLVAAYYIQKRRNTR